MSGFGTGIGRFASGLASGMAARRQMDQQERDAQFQERRLNLMEESNRFNQNLNTQQFDLQKQEEERHRRMDEHTLGLQDKQFGLQQSEEDRHKKADEFNLEKGRSDFDYTQRERGAAQPLVDAERRNKLNSLNDDEEVRTVRRQSMDAANQQYIKDRDAAIKAEKGSDGKETYSVDGESFNDRASALNAYTSNHTFLDMYRVKELPKVEAGYINAGRPDIATAWREWSNHKGIESGVKSYFKMQRAFDVGDWDGVGTHLNAMMTNGDYIPTDRYKMKVTPIKEDGATVGMTMDYEDKAKGVKTSQQYRDINDFQAVAAKYAWPENVFKIQVADIEAAQKGKSELAKQKNDAALDITKERAKQTGPGAEDKEYAETFKQMLETNQFRKDDGAGNLVQMTPEEQGALVMRQMQARRAGLQQLRQQQGATPTGGMIGAPPAQRRVLWQGGGQPAP